MKKFALAVMIFFLVLSTAIIKNTTKKIEDQIFTAKENIRVLKSEFENISLEYDYLSSAGARIFLHDPYVDLWEEKGIEVSSDLKQLLNEDIDILIFCTNHSEYINNKFLIQSISDNKNQKIFIFDTVGVLNQNEINILKQSHTLKVVGRGDL